MIAAMASITVQGIAMVTVAPDRAVLTLALSHVAPTAGAALDEVAARSHRVERLLGEHRLQPADWSTHGVSVAEEWEWKNDTNTNVGFRASSGVTVRIVDLDMIGPLLHDAVEAGGAQIRDLTWSLSPEHPARRELLGAAALDAVQRADAYADALGLQRGAVEAVSDLPIAEAFGPLPTATFARAKSGEAAPISVNGGEIELSATVHVRFTTLPR
ncbi:MAG: hypothetical protein JWN39_293 [Ilumatobacteraceae bacterium]|nr:hypothetical protein [Ilumatobacteraceae bacterium]